ncbi:tRNA threonylcarbamoyladenosine dehydratase [Anaerotruncus rubiinfantis]|uniref:tRNA threonylcarbamoyladenosine dehydratase n=1 Tax=Anaerotruncus rubiinfantis TaxID=1720200 RepID=UPI00311A9D9B
MASPTKGIHIMEKENSWLARTGLLVGAQGLEKLAAARVAVVGLGGVGSAAMEALCRTGVGHLLLVDHDTVDLTNLNRQLVATRDVVGLPKAQAAEKRLRAINPDGDFTFAAQFYLPENSAFLFDWQPDYVVDAIDTVTAKLHLAQECAARGVPLVSCLGTGNRLDPGKLCIGDLAETANGCGCGLARVMRRELRKRGITSLTVCYSREQPLAAVAPGDNNGRHPPGSIAFVPPVAGYLIAAHVARALLQI